MKNLRPTTQYRKDLEKYKGQPQKLADLKEVLEMLTNDGPIPAKYRPHMLRGEYRGCMVCHIQGDFLLIWIDEECDIVELVRLGSHSELLG